MIRGKNILLFFLFALSKESHFFHFVMMVEQDVDNIVQGAEGTDSALAAEVVAPYLSRHGVGHRQRGLSVLVLTCKGLINSSTFV